MAERDFPEIHRRLKDILQAYAAEMEVIADADTEFSLQTHWRRPEDGYPGYFGGVKVGKRYVSYHLMPVYAFPDLLDGISPDLRKRMQGKSCFNFTKVDDVLLAELTDLTSRGYDAFAANGLLENAHG